jgi:hypothetical protein
MSYVVQALDRGGKLVVPIILLSILLTILFGSLSLLLPLHQWTEWRVPILIAAGGAVAAMTAWSSCAPMRLWFMNGLAVVLGLTSATLGIAITLLIAYGLSLQIAEHTGSRDSFVYQMTNPMALCYILCFASIPVVPGVVGVWIAGRQLREAGRLSLAGMAVRFSKLGLGLSSMIGVVVVFAALCRRAMWP